MKARHTDCAEALCKVLRKKCECSDMHALTVKYIILMH